MSRSSQRAFHAQNRGRTSQNRRDRFIQEYAIDCNATQAAKRAGYSAKTAHVQGARLLRNASVAAAIDEKLGKLSEKAEITAEEILLGVRETVIRCKAQGRGFQPFAVLKGYELLGKYKKLWTEKVELTGDNALLNRLLAGRNRLQNDPPKEGGAQS